MELQLEEHIQIDPVLKISEKDDHTKTKIVITYML
jgi:hypothetical protein